jgi:hypothetical protein
VKSTENTEKRWKVDRIQNQLSASLEIGAEQLFQHACSPAHVVVVLASHAHRASAGAPILRGQSRREEGYPRFCLFRFFPYRCGSTIGFADQEQLTAFMSAIFAEKVTDIAGKFNSWDHLFSVTSRQMRELGLLPPQRKLILAQRERFRAVASALPAVKAFNESSAKNKFERDVMSSKA